MKTRKAKVPAALEEVWRWKEKVYGDTADLSTREALKQIGDEMDAVRRQYGLDVATSPEPMMVAEEIVDDAVRDASE